jgi:hypothetical protein
LAHDLCVAARRPTFDRSSLILLKQRAQSFSQTFDCSRINRNNSNVTILASARRHDNNLAGRCLLLPLHFDHRLSLPFQTPAHDLPDQAGRTVTSSFTACESALNLQAVHTRMFLPVNHTSIRLTSLNIKKLSFFALIGMFSRFVSRNKNEFTF